MAPRFYPQIKSEIVECGHDCSEDHHVDRELDLHVGDDLEDVELSDHRHQDRKTSQHRQHRQRQLLSSAKTEKHVC